MIVPGLFALLGMLLACAAMLGIPLYQWIRERKRAGKRVTVLGLMCVFVLGMVGVAALWAFLLVNE